MANGFVSPGAFQGPAQQGQPVPPVPPVPQQQPSTLDIARSRGGLLGPALAGMGLAAAFGANPLAGLLVAAPIFGSAREAIHRGHEDRRHLLEQRSLQSSAQQQLRGLLAGGTPDQRMAGLLLQGYPTSASQVASSLLGRSDPADLRILDAMGLPRTQESLQWLYDLKNPGLGLEGELASVELLMKELELRDIIREQNDARVDRESKEVSLRSTLRGIEDLAANNQALAPTILRPGWAADLRAEGMGAWEFLKRMAGGDTTEEQRMLQTLGNFEKGAANLLNDLLPQLQGINANTDNRLNQIKKSLADIGNEPGTNAKILSETIYDILDIAEINDFDIPRVDDWRSLAQNLRSLGQGQPPKAETRSVTLPDGNVLDNVPMTISDEQAIAIYQQRGQR